MKQVRVGDKVICINGTKSVKGDHVLIAGSEYIVRGIYSCDCSTAYDVGIVIGPGRRSVCTNCGTRFMSGRWVLNSNRFVKNGIVLYKVKGCEF